MLLGLLVMAFAPMIYLALGAFYSITRPLTDKAIIQVMHSMNRASAVLAMIGYVARILNRFSLIFNLSDDLFKEKQMKTVIELKNFSSISH